MRSPILVALGALCLSASAAAGAESQPTVATPVLSGTYLISWVETCSANPSPTFNSGAVTFVPARKTVTITGYKTSGSMSYTLAPLTGSQSYANTATTITLSPGTANAQTYQATYGTLSAGVATSVNWIGVTKNLSCEDMAWLTRR